MKDLIDQLTIIAIQEAPYDLPDWIVDANGAEKAFQDGQLQGEIDLARKILHNHFGIIIHRS